MRDEETRWGRGDSKGTEITTQLFCVAGGCLGAWGTQIFNEPSVGSRVTQAEAKGRSMQGRAHFKSTEELITSSF